MTIRKGDKGPQVMQLQSALMAVGITLPRYGVDGIFGAETEAAVKQAQQKYGLQMTGVADQLLLSRLGIQKKIGQPVRLSKEQSTGSSGFWLLGAVATIAAGIAIKKMYRS